MSDKPMNWTVDPMRPGVVLIDPADPFAGILCGTKARLVSAAPDMLAACQAAVAYDEAIQSCANDPEKMATFCTATGDHLDELYSRWQSLSRAAIAKATGA